MNSYGSIKDERCTSAKHINKEIFAEPRCGFVYFAAVVTSLNIVGMGLSAAYTSSSALSMMDSHNHFIISNEQISWIASLVQLSAIFGGILSGYLSNVLGRKSVLMLNSFPYLLSWLMVAYSPSVLWIYAGRFITGFCCGVATVTVPTYLVEISTPHNRGRLSSLFNVAIAVGAITSMALGIIVPWRWLAIIAAIIVTLNVSLQYFVPESPQWLIAKGYKFEALQALKFLRGNRAMITSEYEEILDLLTHNQKLLKRAEFFEPILFKPILLAIFLTFFQQFSGINPLMAYTTDIFHHIGGSLNPSQATLVVAVVQVFAALLGTTLIDKFGRRVNYTLSGLFVTVGLLMLGLFAVFSIDKTWFSLTFGWMPVIGYIIFLFAFGIGFGPLPFTMTAEMTPLHARSFVVGVATVCMYLFSFIVTKTFQDFQTVLDYYGVFFFYSLISLIGVVMGYICLPETKGKTLEEIRKCFLRTQSSIEADFLTNINEP